MNKIAVTVKYAERYGKSFEQGQMYVTVPTSTYPRILHEHCERGCEVHKVWRDEWGQRVVRFLNPVGPQFIDVRFPRRVA